MELAFNLGEVPKVAVVQDEIEVGGHKYRLSGCTYGDGGHFVAIVRAFYTGKMYFHDGMENNGMWVNLNLSFFPSIIKRYTVNDAVYLRCDNGV